MSSSSLSDPTSSGSGVASVRLASAQPVEIRLFDSTMEPVGRGVGSLTVSGLKPGLYRAEIRAGANCSERLLKLLPGANYTDTELTLPFASVLPLPGTSNFNQAHLNGLEMLSRTPTLALGGDAGLVVFARVVLPFQDTPTRPDLSSVQVLLLNAHMQPVQGFTLQPEGKPEAGWRGVSATLPPGGYLLRLTSSADSAPLDQALFLCPGWQTLVCVPCNERGPNRAGTSVQMIRSSLAGDAGEMELGAPLALALEVATAGLAAGRSLVPSLQIRQLLEGKFANPMLGVIGAYCMFDPASVPDPTSERSYRFKVPEDAGMIATVLGNLRELIPDHPDVAALGELYFEASGTQLFPPRAVAWPPTVALGYRQMMSGERQGRMQIERGSMADQARTLSFACGPWTAWPSEQLYRLLAANFAWQTQMNQTLEIQRRQTERHLQSIQQSVQQSVRSTYFDLMQRPVAATPPAAQPMPLVTPAAQATVVNYLRRVAAMEDMEPQQVFEQMNARDLSAATGLGMDAVTTIRELLKLTGLSAAAVPSGTAAASSSPQQDAKKRGLPGRAETK